MSDHITKVEDDANQASSMLESNQVFQNISLLQIKKSYRSLMDMNQDGLEAFVKKHSDYIIFLLNVLDGTRSESLLGRLTDSALIYLSEEELRNLLIKQVGHQATLGNDIESLSIFMDLVDKPNQNNLSVKKRISKDEVAVIAMIKSFREQYAGRYLKYLDRITHRRQEAVARQLIERNVDVAIGLLLFCPDSMLIVMLDSLASILPRLLRHFPVDVFLKRFEFGYSTYLNKKLKKFLPAPVQNLLDELIEFSQHTETYMLKLIEAFADPNLTSIQKRKVRLEELSQIVTTHKIKHIRIAFYDLREIGVIEDKDLELIESLIKDDSKTTTKHL